MAAAPHSPAAIGNLTEEHDLDQIRKPLALAATLLAATAHADVVFENGSEDAFISGINAFTHQIVTNDFALSHRDTLTALTYNAFTKPDTLPVTNVLVNFYANGGGQVGDLLYTGNFAVSAMAVTGSISGYSLTDYTVNLPDITLDAGAWFLGLEVSPQQLDEHWSIVGNPDPSGTLGSDGWAHYFRIDGVSALPEARSSGLMMLGLLGLGAAAARPRKAAQRPAA